MEEARYAMEEADFMKFAVSAHMLPFSALDVRLRLQLHLNSLDGSNVWFICRIPS
jgi:hypothetical protein